ncbi:MAG TPA: PEP/pyruvate-binding domain-containing protein, partial [Bacteroidales bacterium]|nr:PEP/pyruvate-binding domain-containing protein [Bacteroidales bacterium]
MAIVLQEVIGRKYGDRFYPTVSGVARSINFYPIHPEKADDGIANVALGLGKYIVDGGQTLRFSPRFPRKLLQLASPEMALRETQKHFYALDLSPEAFRPTVDDGANLRQIRVADAEKDGSLKHIASTFDLDNHIIRDGVGHEGRKLITFCNVLQHNVFPLADILSTCLEVGQREMNKPIEIEFAVELNPPRDQPRIFNILQIRPIVDNKESIDEDLEQVDPGDAVITCRSALGNGIMRSITDLVYVKPESFEASANPHIAERMAEVNDRFLKENRNYVLVGPGRWGSSDPWLGIPVKWPHISAARLIVESGLDDYRIDPSQGTHFFQNLTSFRVGYFTINPYISDGSYDLDFLRQQEAFYEDEYLRHIRFSEPLVVKIDGRRNLGVVFKPGKGNGEVRDPQ